MTFAWPWIFLLLPLPLLIRFLNKTDQGGEAIKLPPQVETALSEVDSINSQDRSAHQLLLWLIWILLLCALAQPSLPKNNLVQPASGRTLTLAVDLSSSMERKDFSVNNAPVDRLSVVKQVAGDFIRKRTGDRIGLVLFATEAFIASPPSFDLSAVANTLAASGTGMAGRTTAIGDAIGMAIRNLRDDNATDKAIILLSDGTNNAGSVEPESAAALAARLGITIHTIGLGSDDEPNAENLSRIQLSASAADLDEAALIAIADVTEGRYFRATDSEELSAIYNEIDQLEGAESKPPPLIVRESLVPFLLLPLLLLAWIYHLITIQGRAIA